MGIYKPGQSAVWNVLCVVAALATLHLSRRAALRISRFARFTRESAPLNVSPDSPAASLLIVGDSTAVGAGASSPQSSLTGRIARAYPKLRIRNLARNGATFEAIADQLKGNERFDVILILGGANDVIRLTSAARLSASIDLAIDRASQRADHVIVMPGPNVGNAPIFPPPISWLFTQRARRLHDVIRETAQRSGATYVNLYRSKDTDPFAHDPHRLIASDDLHPSDDGYEVWFAELERQAPLSRFLPQSLSTYTVGKSHLR